jgi:CHASE3 domain sensor protein
MRSTTRNTTNTNATRFRNTAAETRNATITFIVLLSAIVALLVIAIYALMRRPTYDRISDNDSAGRRR